MIWQKRGPIQSNGGAFDKVILRNNLANDPFAGIPASVTQDHNITNATESDFHGRGETQLYPVKIATTDAIAKGAANITEKDQNARYWRVCVWQAALLRGV